jgi:hypothetical protein
VKTQVLQGGLLEETESEPFVKHLVAAKNGETLVKTPQKVPGAPSRLRDSIFIGLVKMQRSQQHHPTDHV